MTAPRHGRISRRTLLRGLGGALALPWLEAMEPSAFASRTAAPPVRLAFLYLPNGVHMPHWRPAADGALAKLPPTLEPLNPVKDRVIVISNLAADFCHNAVAGHEPATGGFLIGGKCTHSEVPEVAGASVDQVAARQIGVKTPVDSLALGVDPGIRGDHGFSGTYLSNISWRDRTVPSSLEINPRQLYDRLYRRRAPRVPDWNGDAPSSSPKVDSLDASVLDLVREDAKSLESSLGFADRRRLEEYFEGLRNIERRLEVADKDPVAHHQDAFKDQPPGVIIPDGRGIPPTYAEHVSLMLDLLTLAFQTDTTRVATFMFSYEKSGRAYPEVDAPGAHHATSHHRGKAENHERLSRINRHHVDLFARLLVRLSRIREGESTLLDNVVLCLASGISDGDRHNHDDLPILVAGGGGGTVKGGRHVALPAKTPICNLYLDLLARVGVPLKQFGDSTGPLGVLG